MSAPTEWEVAVYKAYLEDLGRLGARHETLRAFYLSVVSTLTAIIGFSGSNERAADLGDDARLAVAAVGFLVALLWSAHVRSFGFYFRIKRETLGKLDDAWSVNPFSREWEEASKPRSFRVTYVDQVVAVAFMLLFGLFLVRLAQ